MDYSFKIYVPRRVGLEHHRMICRRYLMAGEQVGGRRVLEIACGSGFGLGYLADRAGSLAAGDCSRQILARAIRMYRRRPEVRLLRFDAHRTPFRAGSFDVVLAMAAIYYFDLDRFLEECSRILDPGGLLLFCTTNQDAPGFHRGQFTSRYYSVNELAGILGRHDFDVRIYGVFPARTGKSGLAQRFLAAGGGFVRLFAFAPEVQDAIHRLAQRLLGYRTVIMDGELSEADMERTREIPLHELPLDRRDACHQMLYGVARRRRG